MKFKSISLFALISIVLLSCNKDGCTDQSSENFNSDATEDDGSCVYAAEKFLGTYNVVVGNCDENINDYVGVISQGPNPNEIVLESFGPYEENIRALVDGNEFSFSVLQGGVGYEGSGYIVNNIVTINTYFCEDYNYPDDCTDSGCSFTYNPQ